MHLDNDYANDLSINILKNSVRLSQENLWTVVSGEISVCLRYKEGKRVEVSLQGSSNKYKDFWVILKVDREDITESFKIKESHMKIIYRDRINWSIDPTYDLFEIEIAKKISAKEKRGLPYGTQSFWNKIQEILKTLDVQLNLE